MQKEVVRMKEAQFSAKMSSAVERIRELELAVHSYQENIGEMSTSIKMQRIAATRIDGEIAEMAETTRSIAGFSMERSEARPSVARSVGPSAA